MSKDKNITNSKNEEDTRFNLKQQDVFNYSFAKNKKNLLVSAAAGSGKTKVLVEKIIDMISNAKNEDKVAFENENKDAKFSLDKMLIMTFTVKATYEMKSRIKKALEEKLSADPSSENLIRESAVIQNANITTIDSFCKKIVDEYYTELNKKNDSLYKNFDPSYRIADEKELSILYNNVLDDFLETVVYVKDKNGKYKYDEFLQSYFKKNSDEKIREMLLDGIKFLSSLAWPIDKLDGWITNKATKVSKSRLNSLYNELKKEIGNIGKEKDFATQVKNMKSAIDFVLNKKKGEYDELSKTKKPDKAVLEKKKAAYEEFDEKAKKYCGKLDTNLGLYKVLKDSNLDVDKFIEDFFNNRIKVGNTLLSSISSVKMVKTIGGGVNNEKTYSGGLAKVSAIEKLFALRESIIEEEIAVKFASNINENIYIELLKEFYLKVVEEKVRRNIYAIGDYANLVLDILYNDDHKTVSQFTTKNISQKYKYIFVDEYQDTNNIQENIISAISSGNNVFMVGDVKQSIYAFRNANPNIFVEKYRNYTNPKNKDGKVITMGINYRSSYKIIGFVNELFKECMTEDFGKVKYEEEGMLSVPTKENKSGLSDEEIEKRKNGKEVEIYIVCDKNRNDEDRKISSLVPKMEAEFVADRIVKLHDEEGMSYNDIVVLMRNPSSRVDFYMDAFSKHNIPCYLDMKKGFFNRVEIRFMVDILNVIDNDRQDIPLANVLTSDIIGITNQELAFIKYAHIKTTEYKHTSLVDDIDYFCNYMKYIDDDKFEEKIKSQNEEKKSSINEETEKTIKKNKGNKEFNEEEYRKKQKELSDDISNRESKIIDQVKAFREICKETYKDEKGKKIVIIDFKQLSEKLEFYKKIFEELRIKSRYLGISELINEVYSLTNIKNIMASMNDGIMRNANLDSLYEFAKDYEATSFVGLFNFMRYIEKIKKLDDDKGLAKASDENDDVVRIMSIHSSKGLEFKCVILTGCGSYYNMRDTYRNVPIQFDSELGIALDGYDLEKKYCIETKKKIEIKEKKERTLKEEEMRVLYVALTRPKERLIVVGGVHNSGQGALSFKTASEYYAQIVNLAKPQDDEKGKKKVDKEGAKKKGSKKEEQKKGESKKEDTKKKIKIDNIECKSYLQLILNNYNPKTENCKLERVEVDIDETDKRKEDKLTLKSIIDGKDLDIKAEKKLLAEAGSDVTIFEKLDSDKLDENLNYTYEYSDWQKIDKSKMSVSDIKREKHDIELFEKLRISEMSNSKLYDDEEDNIKKKEKNSESTSLSDKLDDKKENEFATDRGDAYHRYMQFYDYKKNDFVGNIGNASVDGKSWIDMVKKDKIKAFLATELGKEMAEAFENKTLYREHKFMKLFSVDDINEYRNKIGKTPISINKKLSSDHKIIIQGIIDAFYIKKDDKGEYVVLVDYKTDGLSIKNIKERENEIEDELKNEYKIQLDIYADVLKELTGLEVRNQYIYSFALNKAIDLKEK